MLEVSLVTDREAFAGLREEWNALLSRSGTRHIFLTHQWQYTWWQHFGAGDADLLILLVREGSQLVGIAPLRREVLRVRGVPLLKTLCFLLGYEADYRDFVIEASREAEVLAVTMSYLRTRVPGWHLISLSGLHQESQPGSQLAAVAPGAGLRHRAAEGEACPFVALPPSFPEFLGRMGSRTRGKFQQKLRKLSREHGEVGLEVHCGEQATPEDLAEFLRLHDLSWSGRGGSGAIATERVARFHQDLLAAMAGTPWPLLSILTANGTPCAMIYGYHYDGVCYDYLPGFDPALGRFSPGAQALLKTIEYAIGAGWRELDLMRGDEAYKFHFTRQVRRTVKHWLAPSAGVLKAVGLLEARGK